MRQSNSVNDGRPRDDSEGDREMIARATETERFPDGNDRQ
jgi:hypothetical protein